MAETYEQKKAKLEAEADKVNRIFHWLFAVLGVFLLVGFVGCGMNVMKPSEKSPSRFLTERIDSVGWLLEDTETGKKYLATDAGGIVELPK